MKKHEKSISTFGDQFGPSGKIKEILLKVSVRITMGLFMAMTAAAPCFADITNVGQNAGGWVQEQMLYIAFAIVAVLLIGFIVKKAWIPAATFIIIAAVLLAIMAAPDTLRTFGQSLLNRFTQ